MRYDVALFNGAERALRLRSWGFFIVAAMSVVASATIWARTLHWQRGLTTAAEKAEQVPAALLLLLGTTALFFGAYAGTMLGRLREGRGVEFDPAQLEDFKHAGLVARVCPMLGRARLWRAMSLIVFTGLVEQDREA